MKRLRNVVVDITVHTGLPFWVLDAIFSTPHISSVEFGPSLCLPAECDGSIPKHLRLTGPVASLTSFRRPVRTDTQYSQTPEEAKLLLCLFKRIHHTIEVVEMPIETAPFGAFRRRDWPCLRELVLRGGPRRSLRAYLLENLTRMPNLRVLKLELAHSSESGPQRICPPGWTGGCPWPKLEVLTVSNPHPDEELFAHLPDSLQELTIRCFPRRYAVAYSWAREIKIMHEYGWGLTLPTSDELLRLLRRCGTSLVCLRHLDIEFAASSEDIGLMRHIATAFPTLAFLQIFRYRTDGCTQDVAFWAALGEALTPLTTLRLLRVHFDLRRTENLDETGIYYEGLEGITPQHEEAVTALSCALSPTVQFVCVMVIRAVSFEWIPYRIVRDPTSREAFRIECADKEYECIDGYRYVICLFSPYA
ncbi:hypothetical protein C2E23DRAFT_738028 [Lenzites betulinus]|nr:hypothetical protein C2E23DRAFT_738028 [Lenzites betulinus]